MVKHVADPHLEEISDGEKVKHPAVKAGLEEAIFVLRKTDVIEPTDDPLVVEQSWHVKLKEEEGGNED